MFNESVSSFSYFSDTKPFMIAVYAGDDKPEPSDLLQRTIDEFLELSPSNPDGARRRGYFVNLRQLRGDRPARSVMKGIVGHNGYLSCERCKTKGSRPTPKTSGSRIDVLRTSTRIFQMKVLAARRRAAGLSPLPNIRQRADLQNEDGTDDASRRRQKRKRKHPEDDGAEDEDGKKKKLGGVVFPELGAPLRCMSEWESYKKPVKIRTNKVSGASWPFL